MKKRPDCLGFNGLRVRGCRVCRVLRAKPLGVQGLVGASMGDLQVKVLCGEKALEFGV